MEIFKLFGTILVDSSKAQESISKTEERAEGLRGKLGEGIKTAGKWGLAIGAGAVAAGVAIGGLVMKATDAAGELDDMAQRTGQTAEEFQKYAYAAKLSGMETANLEKLMIKQQKAFADAKDGSKGMSEAYQRLGVDIGSIGTSGEAFDLVIKKLADMKDETTRNALANDIFGKSYADLAPMLNSGSEGIEQLKNDAVALGGVMSNESVSAGAQFGDMLDSAKTALGGVLIKIGVEFMPMLQVMLQWVLDHMPEIQAVISTVFDTIGTVIRVAYGLFKENLLPVLSELLGWIQDHMPQIKAVVGTVFGAIMDIAGQLWGIFKDNLLPILKELWAFIEPTFPLISGVVKVTFGAVVEVVKTVIDIFDKATTAIKDAIDWLTFWNNKDVEEKKPKTTTLRGHAHAGGLAFVPYDGYSAELHRGEKVLTAEKAREYDDTVSGNAKTGGDTYIFHSPKALTPAESRRQMQKAQKQILLGF